MLNKINLFLHLYDKRKEIYKFLLSYHGSPFYKKNRDIIINNSKYCFFQILKDSKLKAIKIGYATIYGEYVI